jgi:hypothetical protein
LSQSYLLRIMSRKSLAAQNRLIALVKNALMRLCSIDHTMIRLRRRLTCARLAIFKPKSCEGGA